MSDHKHATDNERSSESLLETRAQIDPLMSEGLSTELAHLGSNNLYGIRRGSRLLRSVAADAASIWAASGSSRAQVAVKGNLCEAELPGRLTVPRARLASSFGQGLV